MHANEHQFGALIKTARQHNEMTQEELAEKIGIGARYIMKIENEGKLPSFDILFQLVRILNLPLNSIFYPEMHTINERVDNLYRLLKRCSERDLRLINTLAESMLDDVNSAG